ncbi:MAG: ribbon-helix-helix protein, CopG family [Oscillospiraceae bacterium]
MSQGKIGRPKSDDSKHTMFRVRLDDKDLKILDECAEKLKTTRSEVVRNGITMVYERLEEK